MKQIRIPSVLHDVFGEKQSVLTILVILLVGALMTAVLYYMYPEMTSNLPVWRSFPALLLIFDIFAGSIANFTVSTSNYYAARKQSRILFIAIHFHIVIISVLLNTAIGYSIAVWIYTITGAYIVNSLKGRQSQLFIAGLLLSIGVGWIPLLPDAPPYMLVVFQLFMLKVLFGFAVDHYGKKGGTRND